MPCLTSVRNNLASNRGLVVMLITLILVSSSVLGKVETHIPIISNSSSLTIGTQANNCGNCVFPFITNRRESDRCTTVDGNSAPWCATSVDSSGNMLSWEYCTDPSCPGLSATNSPPMTVHPENAAGKCCKYITTNLFLLLKLHISQGVAFLTELTATRGLWEELKLKLANTPGRLEIHFFYSD